MIRAKNKVRSYLLAISFLCIYSTICTAQGSSATRSYTFDVSAYIKKTTLKVNEGDEVHISASGSIVLRGVTGTTGPEGIDGFSNCRMDAVFPYGALLYKIGDDDWNIVDPGDTIIAERLGYLKLMVNDNDPTSNNGRFIVKVKVKSAGTSNAPQKMATKAAIVEPEKSIEPEKASEEVSPNLPAGQLTLSDLQKASGYNLNDAKSFLTLKKFRPDNGSNDHMHKYIFNNDDVSASIIKDVKDNQTTFATSSYNNYKAIKAALNENGYTRRAMVKKVQGVSEYANESYTLYILLVKLNNKYQYTFAIKKL
ncbi:MAG TPA: hypothetical protein VGN20_07550 [Mucilaginibacter sp.]|jgi:hypothetical protein